MDQIARPNCWLPTNGSELASSSGSPLQPGDAVAFGPYVVHGSAPNEGAYARRTLLNGFALPGANRRVYPGCGVGEPVSFSGLRC